MCVIDVFDDFFINFDVFYCRAEVPVLLSLMFYWFYVKIVSL